MSTKMWNAKWKNWSKFHFLGLKFAIPWQSWSKLSKTSSQKESPKTLFLQFSRQCKWKINHWFYFLGFYLLLLLERERDPRSFIWESWFLMNISCVWLYDSMPCAVCHKDISMLNKREMPIFMCSVSTETVLHQQIIYRWCKCAVDFCTVFPEPKSERSRERERAQSRDWTCKMVQFLVLLHKCLHLLLISLWLEKICGTRWI